MRTHAAIALLVTLVAPRTASAELLTLVTDQVNAPIYLSHAGDARLFVAERGGRIRIVEAGALRAEPFLDVSDRVDGRGEGGFLSFAFHPDYAANGALYVSYTTDDPETGFTSVVSRFRVSADPNRADPAEAVLLELPQPFLNHNGGQLQFGPDGQLYVGFGDGGDRDDPGCRAQRGDTWLGKLLRLAVDPLATAPPYYAVPPDNPFAAAADGVLDEIWQLGLRNPWRFSFDRATGELWIGDVGQDALEEVDRAPAPPAGAGWNYGWKVMEANACANPDAASCPGTVPGCSSPAYTPPVAQLSHAGGDRSITGGYVYRGTRAPAFVGSYVFADFGSGRIYALRETASGTLQRSPLLTGGPGWASLGEDADGELYALDLTGDGVYRLDLTAAVSGADRRCITGLNGGLAQLARARASQLRRCVARAAAGRAPGGAEACVAGADARVERARARAARAGARRCALAPPFGPQDATAVAAAALAAGLPALRGLLGADLDAALLLRAAAPAGARCQADAAAALAACQGARLRAFDRCKARGLRAGTVSDAGALAACLAEAPREVAEACGPGRLAPKACAAAGVDLPAAFPACAPADAASVASCAIDAERCQTCRALRDADQLAAVLDCDAFDDGASDGSCTD